MRAQDVGHPGDTLVKPCSCAIIAKFFVVVLKQVLPAHDQIEVQQPQVLDAALLLAEQVQQFDLIYDTYHAVGHVRWHYML